MLSEVSEIKLIMYIKYLAQVFSLNGIVGRILKLLLPPGVPLLDHFQPPSVGGTCEYDGMRLVYITLGYNFGKVGGILPV